MADSSDPPHMPSSSEKKDDIVKSEVQGDTGDANKSKPDKKADGPVAMLPLFQLFRYATPTDKFLYFIAIFFAAIAGAALPLMTIVFGDILDALVLYVPGTDTKQLDEKVTIGCIYFVIIGAAMWVACYIHMAALMVAGENQANLIRRKFVTSVLRQDIGWFDSNETGALTSRLIADTAVVQEGISDKIGTCVQFSCTFFCGFIIAYARGWKLALVLSAVFPVLGTALLLFTKVISGKSSTGQDAYASAGAIAQEVLSSIRTVCSFNGQKKEIERYDSKLGIAEKAGITKALTNGLVIGVVFCLIFASYGLAFWYGSTLVEKDEATAGTVLNVLFAIMIGAFSLGNVGPGVTAIANARGSAIKLYEIIERPSPIDASSSAGLKPDSVIGDIEFKNIDFHYPSRPDVPILKQFNLKIKAGQTVALVGQSGSGKSTIVKLLERFYNPVSGEISLDSNEIKSLNVKWLRQQIGIVSQEPILFNTTVKENILYGIPEGFAPLESLADPHEKEAKIDEMIQQALKNANAWDFVQKLPNGILTNVGEAGSMLSGGQKQRIAIARSIVANPKILLFDEATSALDTESERLVQKAIDAISKKHTSIVIAHRLSTVKNADMIVVMDRGSIIEMGNHEQLVAAGGVYASLVKTQEVRTLEGDDATKPDSPVLKSDESTTIAASEAKIDISALDEIEKKPKGRKNSANTVTPILGEGAEKAMTNGGQEKPPSISYARVFRLNRPEWPIITIGVIFAVANGLLMPLFSIVFSEILTVFSNPDKVKMRKDADFWSSMFAVLAAGALVVNFGQLGSFGYSGEKLTRRIRRLCFSAFLKQEMGYFDMDSHSTGILVSRLADDAGQVQSFSGAALATIVQSGGSLVAGIVIAFIYSWRLALVVLGSIPLMAIAGAYQIKILQGFGEKTKQAYDGAAEVACEAIRNIRTVATLGKEPVFFEKYRKDIVEPHQLALKGAMISTVAFGFSQGSMFFIFALAFYYGSRLVIWNLNPSLDVLKVIFAVIFSAQAAGQATTFSPNFAKAAIAVKSIFDILDRQSRIDYTSNEGEKPERETIKGDVDVKQAQFCYPARPQNRILKNLNVFARPGQTVALVGPSGCGKSTVIGLTERFYDLTEGGEVQVENIDVKKWELNHLRNQISLVGQEPVLFNTSIRENIAYGSREDNELVSNEKIEAVARMANIHDFIMGLPEGYNTNVGERGGKISGGQKQRIAIARALIREPKILLLDEATSALDSESEHLVQAALDAAAKNRTTIVIAHRLSTIQDADYIFVVRDGQIVEQGKHNDLLENRATYFDLVQQQKLVKE